MIGIIDYDAGNIKSVEKALDYLGEKSMVTRDPQELLAADKVILPGVGSFGDAMENLKKCGIARRYENEDLDVCMEQILTDIRKSL